MDLDNNRGETKEISDEIQIIEAGPQDIPSRELDAFVDNLYRTRFIGVPFIQKARLQLKECLEEKACIVEAMPDSLKKYIKRIGSLVSQETPSEEYKARDKGLIQEALKNHNVLAAQINGKNVGMIAVRKVEERKMPDGRALWIIMKASVPPEYEGRGIYKKLADAAFQKIQRIDPRAPIYRMSKVPNVQVHLRKLKGWHETQMNDPDDHVAALFRQGRSEEYVKQEVAEGYKIYYFEPLEQQDHSPPPTRSPTS